MLVVLEGVDGLGKSAIISAVRKAFPLNNVVICSDPCKEHPATLAIRQYIFARGDTLPVESQVKLFEAARLILWHDIIEPALQANELVICDRIWLSNWVYQDTKVEAFPKVDLLFYLHDGTDNDLHRKYTFSISQAIYEKAILEAEIINALDIEKAADQIITSICGKKAGLRRYN
mgnify:FL=1